MLAATRQASGRVLSTSYPDLLPLIELAGSPDTPPEELLRLHQHPAPEIQGVLAGNRSTPPEVLGEIARELSGPNGELASRYGCETSRKLAAHPNTPSRVLERWFTHPSLVGSVAANPSTPPTILIEMAAMNPSDGVLLAIANNPAAPSQVLASVALRRGPIRRAVAGHPRTPARTLMDIARWEDSRLVKTVEHKQVDTYHPAATRWVLEKKIEDDRMGLIGNPSTPVEAYEILASGPHVDLRMALAASPGIPLAISLILADDEIERVCLTLIHNPSIRAGALRGLAMHPSRWVRRSAARHPDCPPDTLIELARDRHTEVRLAVAKRPDAPAQAREQLLADQKMRIRRSAPRQQGGAGLLTGRWGSVCGPFPCLAYIVRHPKWTSKNRSILYAAGTRLRTTSAPCLQIGQFLMEEVKLPLLGVPTNSTSMASAFGLVRTLGPILRSGVEMAIRHRAPSAAPLSATKKRSMGTLRPRDARTMNPTITVPFWIDGYSYPGVPNDLERLCNSLIRVLPRRS